MRAGLARHGGGSMRSVNSSVAGSGMSESRQLSVVKRRHMVVLVTGTFLIYSTVSTIVFQVLLCSLPKVLSIRHLLTSIGSVLTEKTCTLLLPGFLGRGFNSSTWIGSDRKVVHFFAAGNIWAWF